MREIKSTHDSFLSQKEELTNLRENYRKDVETLQTQLNHVTEEANERKERFENALKRWIREFAFASSREKQMQIARTNVNVGHIAMQQLGHRVVETWCDGIVRTVIPVSRSA